ncbi:MAG: CotH kinase family protein [Dysgonamonadaceae bacterium]|nr:CotH kinase family protein [Dysgonamonadaceae bacterium]
MKKTFSVIIFTFISGILLNFSAVGQTASKINPENIIGSVYSVDYDDNNSRSTTVNVKSNAFDGDLNTFFASYDRSNAWVGLDLGEKYIITQIAYCPRKGWPQRLELGVFEGANHPDFGDAVLLHVITQRPDEDRMTEQTVVNSRGFRYIRYIGPNDVRCNIAELEFYGYPGEGDNSRLTQITNIPDVIIHTTQNKDITSKTTYVKGIVTFISKDGTDVFTDSLEIRGRGNASWGFEKKPYRIKLAKKARVLGNPAEGRNWTLISNHGDKTLMRNLLAFDFAQRIEMPYTPAGQPVNLYLNGEYKGCYQLCDHIDVRKNRVDVKEMKTTDTSGENLTGGYLIEIDAYADTEKKWFNSGRGIPVTIKSPDDEDIVPQQFDYIQSHFNKWETAIHSSNYKDPETGFRMYMDTQTFVRHFLVGEWSGNTDTYWSVYMYKQRGDEKFYFGPVWDFDLAFDNDTRTYPVNSSSRTDWLYRSGGSGANGVSNLVNRLLSDQALYEEIRKTYSDYRDWEYITEEKLLGVIDDYAGMLDASQKMNFKRWDVINKWVHMINHNTGSYQGEVDIVKRYVKNRIAWLDKRLNYIPDPDNKPVTTNMPVVAPFRLWTEGNTIHLDGITESTFIEVFNLVGQAVSRQYANRNVTLPVSPGAYIVRLSSSNGKHQTIKCIIS